MVVNVMINVMIMDDDCDDEYHDNDGGDHDQYKAAAVGVEPEC